MSVVSVSLPDSLLKQIDELAKRRSFAGRSEIFRAALRDFVAKEMQDPGRDGERPATMTLVYPKGHERRIGEIRHEYSDVLTSMTHSDLGDECVEVFMLRGEASRIREFSERLRAYRESLLVQTIFTDVARAGETPRARHH